MPYDNVLAARLHQHLRRNLPGERAFFLPKHILCADRDLRALCRLYRRRNVRKRWRDHHVAIAHSRHQRLHRGKECARVCLCLVHLPISRDDAATLCGAHLFVRASTPGSFVPPRNSSDAPPPVDICEICLATPDWCTAATESPPPIIEVAPAVVAAATALAISSVPVANAGISNTPIGPFHTMVLALASSALYAAIVFGPMSRPIWSAGIAVESTTFEGASALNSGAITSSTGRRNLKFFCFASARIFFAKSILSASTSDFPTPSPCALRKV